MARLVGRKLLHGIVVLFVVSLLLSFLIELAPGDPALALLGETATEEQIDSLRDELGLDDPVHVRYGDWAGGIVQGDFGTSYRTKTPVLESITAALPVTLEVALLALLLSYAVAIPLAVYAAYREGSRIDRFLTVASSLPLAVPSFVTALVLVYIFAVRMRNFPLNLPATGWVPLSESVTENLRHVALPVVTLAIAQSVGVFRILRGDMVATLREDFILAARAKGVPPRRILVRHALRPSSFQLVTLVGLALGNLLSGAVVIEQLFALPGMGRFLVRSIEIKDVPAVQGAVMFIAVSYVVVNVLVDVAYGYLDPRVRTGARAS